MYLLNLNASWAFTIPLSRRLSVPHKTFSILLHLWNCYPEILVWPKCCCYFLNNVPYNKITLRFCLIPRDYFLLLCTHKAMCYLVRYYSTLLPIKYCTRLKFIFPDLFKLLFPFTYLMYAFILFLLITSYNQCRKSEYW